ncbi:MAG: hypothetical protein A2Z18_07040 [Armatimonadetes bacterium RBG_16_58_9]|nr:MAG: hypothetical protein A2Z18_07040 [Armatimonadetes bacterium RBG_16_58_9]
MIVRCSISSKRIIALIITALAVAVVSSVVIGQNQPSPNPEKKSDVAYKADWWKYSEKTQTMHMKGNVRFQHEDTVLTSDEVLYKKNNKNDTASSPGKLRIVNAECEIDADKGSADFNKKTGTLEGKVVMVVKPKEEKADNPDKQSVGAKLKKPTTINCPKLEYQYKAKIATATGGVDFKQEKRSGRADKAYHDQNKELLTLMGNVKGVDEDGQTFAAEKVTISLKKGDEWMEVLNGSGSFKVNLEEEGAQSKQQ